MPVLFTSTFTRDRLFYVLAKGPVFVQVLMNYFPSGLDQS